VTTVAAPLREPAPNGEPGVRRRRRHPTHRHPDVATRAFRPVDEPRRRPPAGAGHRRRSTGSRCDDPRAAARAAALRRRHVLLAVVAVGLLVALAVPWAGKGSDALSAPGPVATGTALSPHTVYVVQRGDTLWSIAERLDPQGDPRPVMTALSAEAGGDTVRPGERLLLP